MRYLGCCSWLGNPPGEALGVALDAAGGVVFMAGSMSEPDEDSDLYMAAFEISTGQVLWTWMHGTIYLDTLTDLAFDDENGVLYACGYTRGNFSYALDADPAPDFKPLDMVVLALDPSTQETIWLKTYTSGPLVDRDDFAYAITFDRNGVLHVGGTTRGTGFDTDGSAGEDDPDTRPGLRRFVFVANSGSFYPGTHHSTFHSNTNRDSYYPSTHRNACNTSANHSSFLSTHSGPFYPCTHCTPLYPSTHCNAGDPSTHCITRYISPNRSSFHPSTDFIAFFPTAHCGSFFPSTHYITRYSSANRSSFYASTHNIARCSSANSTSFHHNTNFSAFYPTTQCGPFYSNTHCSAFDPSTHNSSANRSSCHPSTHDVACYSSANGSSRDPSTHHGAVCPCTHCSAGTNDGSCYPSTDSGAGSSDVPPDICSCADTFSDDKVTHTVACHAGPHPLSSHRTPDNGTHYTALSDSRAPVPFPDADADIVRHPDTNRPTDFPPF
ncbi:unnamed protein product [Ectocarpus fasciculatus]